MKNDSETSEYINKNNKKSRKTIEEIKSSIAKLLETYWEKILFKDNEFLSILTNEQKNKLWKLTESQKEQYQNINFISQLLKILNNWDIRSYIQRKNNYLKEHRTISEWKFKKLFWWSGKFWKTSINQKKLWLCYAYTWFELLKKTNWFDELIQTNLKETAKWREVRLPFCGKNWEWIKVNKNEIDKMFITKNKDWNNTKICINSESEYLWFKILEIAFIKKEIINKYLTLEYRNKKIPKILEDAFLQYYYTWDIKLNLRLLRKIEWWNAQIMFYSILPENYIISNILYNWINDNMKDLAFDNFLTWLYKISLWINNFNKLTNIWSEITLAKIEKPKTKTIIIKDANIIYKENNKLKNWYILDNNWNISEVNMENNDINQTSKDIVTDQNWKNYLMLFPWHSYSIEKCYTTPKWERRVRIINPRHTWVKFDISLDECKKIFNRGITWLNINNMFR